MQELGEKVYQVQAALARRQSQLEDHHRTSAQTASDRREAQEKLEVVKKQYSRTTSEVAQERSQGEAPLPPTTSRLPSLDMSRLLLLITVFVLL